MKSIISKSGIQLGTHHDYRNSIMSKFEEFEKIKENLRELIKPSLKGAYFLVETKVKYFNEDHEQIFEKVTKHPDRCPINQEENTTLTVVIDGKLTIS